MKWEIAKTVAIKAAPVVLGMLLGVGGTKAMQTTTEAKATIVECTPKVVIQKPDPIKVELICPKK